MFGGVSAALGLHFGARQVAAEVFLNLVFNGQAVAIPARHITRVHALELSRFDDHVLEHFVHRMTNVELTVGVGRTVVQDKLGCAAAGLPKLVIESGFVPRLDPCRFTFWQIAPHREGRVWQVQGIAVVAWCGLIGSGHANAQMKMKCSDAKQIAFFRRGRGGDLVAALEPERNARWLNSPEFGRVWFGAQWQRPTIGNSRQEGMRYTMNS